MKQIKKWFLTQEMPWKKVIIFAVITAVVTAGLNLIPALRDTSFQDIAIDLDCWILVAIFIIVNCDTCREAALKTFVFFLVSQPLIYLLEVPFNSLGFGLFRYYGYWFKLTLLTLPGAAIAFQIKRKNWLSVLILSVATGLLGYMAAEHFWSFMTRFPHHLLSFLFCIVTALALVFIVLDKKAHRIAGICVVAAAFAAALYLQKPITDWDITLPEGEWSYTVEDTSLVSVSEKAADIYTVSAEKDGNTFILFENENGETAEYAVTVSNGRIFVNQID